MPKIKHINSFREDIDHINDDIKSLGFDYHKHILQNVVSPELFSNPVNDTPLRQIERLIEHLVDAVRQIKLTYAYALPKNSKMIN